MILTIKEQFKNLSFWDKKDQTAEAVFHIQHLADIDILVESCHHKDIIKYTKFTQADIDKELQRKADVVRVAQIKANMTPSNPHNRKPKQYNTTTKQYDTTTKLKTHLEEVAAMQAEVEIELAKVELAQQKLNARREQLRIKAEQDKLDAEEQRQQVIVLEAKIEAQTQINKLHIRLEALTEQANQLRAKIRQQLNLDRTFTNRQRSQLYLNAGGKCQICGDLVTITNFEADHIIPYSKGGPTTIENGQCLCRSCNRKKGTN